MKTRLNLIWLAAFAFTLLGNLQIASAFYNPATQRWLSRDPLGEKGDLNLYRFALNDGINWLDPDGRFAMAIPIAIGGLRACLANPACAQALERAMLAAAAAAAAVGTAICLSSPRSEECQREWEDAYRRCEQLLARPWPPREMTGGYSNLQDCARGFVSEGCGGNPTANLRWPNIGGIIGRNAPPIRF